MAAWTDAEQLMLELVNRARLDPLGEAARFGIDLNQGLAAGTLDGTAKQVLAPNAKLLDAARAHSQWMLDTDTFSHTGVGGSSPGDRMTSAGYAFTGSWTWGENIAWQGSTGSINANSYIVDEHENLFLSSGHRENILNGQFREIGIGALTGNYAGYNALMTTQAFAKSGASTFVTGVAYNDASKDKFYSVGEGQGGISVQVAFAGATTSGTTASTGGYSVATGSGSAGVTFSGGGLAAPISLTVDTTAGNAKVDLVGGVRLELSASSTLGVNAKDASLLGVAALSLTGNDAANTLLGNSGANTMSGAGGNDTVSGVLGNDMVYGGGGNDTADGGIGNDGLFGQQGNDSLTGAAGNDVLNGGAGLDTLAGGAGSDTFVFNVPLATGNVDRIADFSVVDDQIRLDRQVFTALTAGTLGASSFAIGSAASNTSQRIIYDKVVGALYYDADGAGGAAQVKFATIAANLTIAANDFVIV